MALLRVRRLVKRFGGVPAVDGLDLDVTRGEILAVIGPNGAGKSTLVGLIGGTLAPTTSDGIDFDGTDLAGLRPHRIRRLGVATVRQTPDPFGSMTVRENVMLGAMFGGATRLGEADAASVAAHQLDLVGLNDQAGWSVDRLTLEQRHRLELARALAGRPRLLLLDEVMAGLDPVELDAAVVVIRRIRDELGVTVLWVEHVMRAVTALADRVVVLDVGRELAQGPPDDVMRDERVVEVYLGRGADRRAAD